MPADETSQSEAEPFLADMEKLRIETDAFFSAHRTYLDDTKTSIQIATDTNKQISSIHERLMLINLGAIGLSVTALTSVGGKLSTFGAHRNTVIICASLGWLLLLSSALLCRAVMFRCIGANKHFMNQWMQTVSAYHRQQIAVVASRINQTFQGSVPIGGRAVDARGILSAVVSAVQSNELPDPKTTTEKLQALLENKSPAVDRVSGKLSAAALVTMQFGFISLGVAAILLVVGLG
jgi:hypothetical protein